MLFAQPPRFLFHALALAAVTFALSAAPARAADYRVVQCANAPHDFIPFSESPGMYVEDKCGSIGAVSVRASLGTFITTEHDVMWLAWAPDGTTFSSWQALFLGGASNNTGFATYAMACADTGCVAPIKYLFFGLENWATPVSYHWEGAGALRLQMGIVCSFGAATGCTVRSYQPGLDMFAPEMTLTDHYAPTAPQLTGGTLLGTGWQSGRQAHSISFSASDRGGGVNHVVASVTSGASWTSIAPCARGNGAYTRLVPCPLAFNGALPISVGALADGRHDLRLTAVDAAGQTASSGVHALFVDNTAPEAPTGMAVAGGEGWRATDGFAVRWRTPAEQFAPIAAAHWKLCAIGGTCRTGRAGASQITGLDGLIAGRSGDYLLQAWFEDAAGNYDPAKASAPVHLRLDADAPRPAFEALDPARPQRVAVAVRDDASGLAGGTIEVQREGAGAWRPLATSVEGDRLVASLDDEALPDGRYELRARAVDRAGNEASTDRDLAGARVVVQLPLRVVTRLRAGRRTTRTRRVTVRRHGRRSIERRRIVRLMTRTLTRPGRLVSIDGVLESSDGRPLAGVDVSVLSGRSRSSMFELLGTVPTDAAGRFRYRARPARSAVLRLRYGGSDHVRGSTADVMLGVRATSSIHASEASVLNGESVILSGRVGTRPIPRRGKLVEVQAFFRDRWRTFSTVRTNRRGRWLLPYTFGGTVGTVRYRFRARLPGEGGYGFEPGVSRTASVTVHGL